MHLPRSEAGSVKKWGSNLGENLGKVGAPSSGSVRGGACGHGMSKTVQKSKRVSLQPVQLGIMHQWHEDGVLIAPSPGGCVIKMGLGHCHAVEMGRMGFSRRRRRREHDITRILHPFWRQSNKVCRLHTSGAVKISCSACACHHVARHKAIHSSRMRLCLRMLGPCAHAKTWSLCVPSWWWQRQPVVMGV